MPALDTPITRNITQFDLERIDINDAMRVITCNYLLQLADGTVVDRGWITVQGAQYSNFMQSATQAGETVGQAIRRRVRQLLKNRIQNQADPSD